MGPKINQKQIESVMRLEPPKRYSHFIKMVADWESVWGLYNDGWALTETAEGKQVFPFWPAKEYAQTCAEKEWKSYVPEKIPLSDFMDELLPKLDEDGVLPGVFFVPGSGSVDAPVSQIIADLKQELNRIE